MSVFVLVHGAFRGGWAWRRVRPLLVAAGYDVHAPSLLGAGERAAYVGDVRGLDSWVDDLEALVVVEDLRDVVLVGHSQGGLVTTALAARIPHRLRCVVHLDAAVPRPGERAIDLLGAGGPVPERGAVVAPRPLEAGGDLDEESVAWMNARLCATPVAPSLDPVPAVPAQVPQVFAFCARTPDGYPSRVTQARRAAAGECDVVLDCGHDAPMSAPGLVAQLLLAAAHAPDAIHQTFEVSPG
ncbi:alpha/beta fold hydrolase [Nocardioides sp. zg-DK7169]|uniref:alpha/beta fold hydrolase n=1 Tax=Nocardioides sp. zg-DK7169 TaxID=2736600 RepID=UPI001555177D|nr:alpha/beta fold hydrolase [Nocardioides sp. zg-DK7169]